MLVETPRLGTLSSLQRVKVHRTAIGAMMKMLGERSAELASTTTGAAQRAIAEGRAGDQRYYFVSPSVYSDTPPCGYRLTDAQYQSTQRTLGLQGITATPAGGYWNVSGAQAAQPVIGLLLDLARVPGNDGRAADRLLAPTSARRVCPEGAARSRSQGPHPRGPGSVRREKPISRRTVLCSCQPISATPCSC